MHDGSVGAKLLHQIFCPRGLYSSTRNQHDMARAVPHHQVPTQEHRQLSGSSGDEDGSLTESVERLRNCARGRLVATHKGRQPRHS